MITVHHLKHSQSFRIVWLLEELGVPYDLIKYERNPDGFAPEDYKRISSTGTSPCITTTTTDGEEFSLSETNAVMDYILDSHPGSAPLRPKAGSPERVEYLFWFHSVQGTLQPVMTVDTLFRVLPGKVPWPINVPLTISAGKVQENFVLPRLSKLMSLAEKQLAKHEFLAGDAFTAADICAVYTLESVLTRYPDLSYPHCSEWLARMYQRPKFQAAQTKVGEEHVVMTES